MRKLAKILTYCLVLASLGYAGWSVYSYYQNTREAPDWDFSKMPNVKSVKQEVNTSGLLRGRIEKLDSSWLTRAGTIDKTNEQRKENNLPALKENRLLGQAAQKKMQDMFSGQYFEHVSPSGTGPADLAKAVQYEYVAIGENLALGNYKNDQELVTAWMNSPGHRANILNSKYLEIGVAVGKGMFDGHETWLAVQEFGKPASACPSVDSALKERIQALRAEVASLELQVSAAKAELSNPGEVKDKAAADAYNKKVNDYNVLVGIYNNKVDTLKLLTAQYNQQVNAYNACLN
jgi:hypothetical protein